MNRQHVPVEEEVRPAARPRPAHPDTLPHRPKHGWVLWLVLAVLCVAGYFAYRYFTRPAEGQANSGEGAAGQHHGAAAVPVLAATAKRGDMPIYLNGLGTVTPIRTVMVHTRVDGQLDKVLFKEGQIVHEKDPLVEIDPRPFQAALDKDKGLLARDQALLKNAKVDLKRYQDAKDAIPEQQLATQEALVAQDEANVESDEGQVESDQVNLAYCHITADATGRIGLRMVDPGNIVHAVDANAMAVITQLQPITVIFQIAEDNLSQVTSKPDNGAGLEAIAYDRDLTKKLATGKLLTIDNQINSTNGMTAFRAEFLNEHNELFPGEFVNVRLLVNTVRDTVLVPTAVVQTNPQGTPFVYVVKNGKTVQIRNITTGPSEGDTISVTNGLEVDEVVVTDGVDKLRDGAAVTLGSSSASAPASGSSADSSSENSAGNSSDNASANAPADAATHPAHAKNKKAAEDTQ